jgi:hypothetical protein
MNTMDIAIEPLETLESPIDWWAFGIGVAVGVAIALT